MTKQFMLVMTLLLVATDSSARERPFRRPGAFPTPESVLWIAAHPDDEAVAAPLLAKWCLDERARCGFLVLTRGEAGGCVLGGGCLPDVASTRSAEAGAASELFRAESILLRYPDGGGVHLPPWSEVSGDQPSLVARIASLIEAFGPELVLTFDPRHGTTCHPDHRETGRVVLEAVQLLESKPSVYLLETYVTFAAGAGTVEFTAALPGALRFDANQLLSSGAEAWTALAWDMERHPSQFTTQFVEAVRNVPQDQRAVFIAPAETGLQLPVTACPR
jgi:LmbE family N-acetylglucosaminyl deacetylase